MVEGGSRRSLCRSCGKEVAPAKEKCPYCGQKVKAGGIVGDLWQGLYWMGEAVYRRLGNPKQLGEDLAGKRVVVIIGGVIAGSLLGVLRWILGVLEIFEHPGQYRYPLLQDLVGGLFVGITVAVLSQALLEWLGRRTGEP